MEARRGREGESIPGLFHFRRPQASLLTPQELWSLIRRISGERLYELGIPGDRDMSDDERPYEEWRQIVRDWRSVWRPWNEVMDRITRDYSQTGKPSDEDLKLEDQLNNQLIAAETRMHEFRQRLLLPQE